MPVTQLRTRQPCAISFRKRLVLMWWFLCCAHSMTKPLTSVAIMMLYEEGRFQLDDPISKFAPMFKNMRVAAGGMRGKIDTAVHTTARNEVSVKHEKFPEALELVDAILGTRQAA